MCDEYNPQPQDELSEDQLAEVSGGISADQAPIGNAGISEEGKKKNPKDQQQYLQIELENVQITSYQLG
jgi:bacteriocin-like protein